MLGYCPRHCVPSGWYFQCKRLCSIAEKYSYQGWVGPRKDRVKVNRNGRRPARLVEDGLNPVEDNLSEIYPLSWGEMASWWTEEEVNFPYLDRLENKLLHLIHFEGKSYSEIAQHLVKPRRGRWSKDAIRLKYQRILKRIGASLSRGSGIVKPLEAIPLVQKAPDWIERKRLTRDQKAEKAKVAKERFNQHKLDLRGLATESVEEFIARCGKIQKLEPVLPRSGHGVLTMSAWRDWAKKQESMEDQEKRMEARIISPATSSELVEEIPGDEHETDQWNEEEEKEVDDDNKEIGQIGFNLSKE